MNVELFSSLSVIRLFESDAYEDSRSEGLIGWTNMRRRSRSVVKLGYSLVCRLNISRYLVIGSGQYRGVISLDVLVCLAFELAT